jgi:hypothetical protein
VTKRRILGSDDFDLSRPIDQLSIDELTARIRRLLDGSWIGNQALDELGRRALHKQGVPATAWPTPTRTVPAASPVP